MNASAPRTRRILRAALGLFFAFYCLALRPAARALSAGSDSVPASRTSSANLDAPRTRASGAAFVVVDSDDGASRIVPTVARPTQRLRRIATLAPAATSSSSCAFPPPPASGSAAPVFRDAGVPPYPPSVLS